MAHQAIHKSVANGIMEIVMFRPERKNSFTAEMYRNFHQALLEAEENHAVRVILIQGAGGDFSAGNDLQDFLDHPPADESAPVFQFLMTLAQFTKPIVCAVTGYAVGIGTTMLLHADLVYASETARFQLPFVSLGLVPEAGSSLLLAQRCGHLVASELLLLGEAFTPEMAMRSRIVNQIVKEEHLLPFARERAFHLAQKPMQALISSKELIKRPYRAQLLQHMRAEAVIFMSQLRSVEAKSAISGFFNRKKV